MRYCKKCKKQFDTDLRKCPDCKKGLQPILTEEEMFQLEQEMNDFTVIETFVML